MACRTCPSYIKYFGEPNNQTWTWPPQPKQIPTVPGVNTPRKTVEEYEYDKEGRMIKKTITEE
jgi:hypothetical protein